MNLENGQKQTLAANIKAFMKAKGLTLSGMQKHGVAWQTAKNLSEGKVGKYITVGLTGRLEKLTSQSMGALITDKIEWKEGPLRETRAAPRAAPRRAAPVRKLHRAPRETLPTRTPVNGMFTVEYGDGTKVAVASGSSISITGPRSIKVHD